MTERCKNCGAELFAGQQFCRQCGARTGFLSRDDVATQILPGQQPPPADTTPFTGERHTDPNFRQRPTGAYQPQQVTPLAVGQPPARRRSPLGWVLAIVAICCIGALSLAAAFFYQQARQASSVRVVKINPPTPPAMPNMPAPPSVATRPDAETLDEDDADVSDEKTVITKTFPLAPEEGQFVLANLNGDVKIEGWDEPQAEVRVTKQGGTPDERGEVEIKFAQSDNHLELSTAPGHISAIKAVSYEIKLPRRLRHISLNTTNGDVKMVGVHANIEIATQRGDIKLADVSGALTTRTLAGDTKVALAVADAPQNFNTVNGDIEVQLGDTTNAQIKAETMAGEIKSDDALGLKVEKQIVGQHVAGQLGRGGPPVTIKAVHGDIRIKK